MNYRDKVFYEWLLAKAIMFDLYSASRTTLKLMLYESAVNWETQAWYDLKAFTDNEQKRKAT